MTRFNVIPLGRQNVQPLPVRAKRDDLVGAEIALRNRQLAEAASQSEEDRELRELALLLGAEQTQAQLDITRDQLTQQGEQFSTSLEATREEAALDRELRARQLDHTLEQLDFMREQLGEQARQFGETLSETRSQFATTSAQRQQEIDRMETEFDALQRRADRSLDLERISSDLHNSISLGNLAAQSATLEVRQRAEDFKNTAQGFNDVFAGQVNNVRNIMSNVSDDDTLEKNIGDIENAVSSFTRGLRNAVTDENLTPQQAFGALTAVVGDSVFGGRLLDVLENDLLTVRQVAGRGNRKRIDKIIKGIRDAENELLVPALQANARFQQALVSGDAELEIARQNLNATRELVTTASEARRFPDATFPIDAPEIEVPPMETGEFKSAIEALRNQLQPGGAAGGPGANAPPAIQSPGNDPFATKGGEAVRSIGSGIRSAASAVDELVGDAVVGAGNLATAPFQFADQTPAAREARGRIRNQQEFDFWARENVTAHRMGEGIVIVRPDGVFIGHPPIKSASELQQLKNQGFQVPGL